jgi:hypothetical protein
LIFQVWLLISIQVARRLPFLRHPLLLLVPAISLGIITADDDEANRASSTYTFKLLYTLSGDSSSSSSSKAPLTSHRLPQQQGVIHLSDLLDLKTLWAKAKRRVDAFAYRQFEGQGGGAKAGGPGRAAAAAAAVGAGGPGVSAGASTSSSSRSGSSSERLTAVVCGPAPGRWLLVTPCCQALVALKAVQRAKAQQQQQQQHASKQQQQGVVRTAEGPADEKLSGVLSASAVLGSDIGWFMEQVQQVLGVEVIGV